MKTVVVLSVLVLALIGGAAAGKEKAESKTEEECKTLCLDQKLKEPVCKETCALNQRFETVWTEALECSVTCRDNHGKGTPATKACEEACKMKYEQNVAELAGSCHAVCTKEEKEPTGVEKCRKICAPSLIYKEMKEKKEKATAEAKH